MNSAAIRLVTGPSGAGKTAFCSKLIQAVSPLSNRLSVRGILSIGKFEGGEKHAILARDVANGQERTLAVPNAGRAGPLYTARWQFNQETIEWCNQVLAEALPCDLLVVDELGPLEFERGQGFQQGLVALDSRRYQLALVSIRPGLLRQALRRWTEAVAISVGEDWMESDSARETVDHLVQLLSS